MVAVFIIVAVLGVVRRQFRHIGRFGGLIPLLRRAILAGNSVLIVILGDFSLLRNDTA